MGSHLGKFDAAIDDDLERAGLADHQLDVLDSAVPEPVSRTESTGLVVSSLAVLDSNSHGRLLDYPCGNCNESWPDHPSGGRRTIAVAVY